MPRKSFLPLCILAALLFGSCSAPLPEQPSATVTPFDPATQAALPPTSTSTPPVSTLTVDLSKETCLADGGRVEAGLNLPSASLEKGLPYRVYTPPCYDQYPDQRYPVLYLIHGQTYNDDQWDRLGADETADQLIADGAVAPFIMVMPADQSHFTQPADNGFDEAVVNDLIPWIDANYRTIPDRAHRAIGGLSRGASWSIHIALTHPELFGALGGNSPPVFDEDAYRVKSWLDNIPPHLLPRIWLDIGRNDQQVIMDSAVWFEGLLDQRDIPHQWTLFDGGHSEKYWGAHVEDYLRWYAADW